MRAGKVLHTLEQGSELFTTLAGDIVDDGFADAESSIKLSENRIRQPVTEYLQILNRHEHGAPVGLGSQTKVFARRRFLLCRPISLRFPKALIGFKVTAPETTGDAKRS